MVVLAASVVTKTGKGTEAFERVEGGGSPTASALWLRISFFARTFPSSQND